MADAAIIGAIRVQLVVAGGRKKEVAIVDGKSNFVTFVCFISIVSGAPLYGRIPPHNNSMTMMWNEGRGATGINLSVIVLFFHENLRQRSHFGEK